MLILRRGLCPIRLLKSEAVHALPLPVGTELHLAGKMPAIRVENTAIGAGLPSGGRGTIGADGCGGADSPGLRAIPG